MADSLEVWLSGVRVAVVERARDRLSLSYAPEALESGALGTPLLSLSLPLTEERYPNAITRSFLDGLLPEGDVRRALAEQFGLPANDTFGLIAELGRDCAGAIVIQPDGAGSPPPATVRSAERITPAELEQLVAGLRTAPLGVGPRVRLSLAGVQEKLVLTRLPDGSWARPVDGTPTTHILKPEIAAFPNTVENEAFCMRVARRLGLSAASVETTVLAGRRFLVVERYDRAVDDDGNVVRLHQEDLCQATGIPPTKKYQEDGGPSLRRIAKTVELVAGPGTLETLLRMVALNVLVGNGDAHGKNYSLLHDAAGSLSLAPVYDVLSTIPHGQDRLAMYVDDVRRLNRVTRDRIANEATSWGVPVGLADEVVADVLDRAPVAIEAARDETAGLPDEILDVVRAQLSRLAASN